MPDTPPMLKKHYRLLELLKLDKKLGKVDGAHEEWLSIRNEIAELQEELLIYRDKEKQALISQHEESLIRAERKKAEWRASNPDTNVLYYPSSWWIDTLERILRELNSGASDPYSVWDDEYKAISDSFDIKPIADMDKKGKEATSKGMIECAEPFVPSCKWTANPEDYTGHWTTCHNEFTVSDWDEDYNMHSFKFCIYCGHPLQQVIEEPEPEPEDEDLKHDYFVKISGLWQQTKAADYPNYSLPKFMVDVTTIPLYSLVISQIKGHAISDASVEKELEIKIENGGL